MTIYRSITILNTPHPNQQISLSETDIATKVDGGYKITFGSSPSTTTFYPFHRIWEYQEINTSMAKERTVFKDDSDNGDDSML
jgi:hypothetical protein